MKKFFASLLMILVVCLSFTGCAPKAGPKTDDPVIGNGGLAIVKGDYLYFVNGYMSKTEEFDNNKKGKVTKSGIYRVKTKDATYTINYDTNGDGKVDSNDSDPVLEFNPGTLTSDEDGNISGAEQIVSYKVGFEYGGFYIYGDYIYFATPGNRYDRKPDTQRLTDVDFYRVKLNGTGYSLLYSITGYEDSGKFAFYENGGDVYGVFYNGGNDFTIIKNTKKLFTKDDVKEAVIPKVTESFKNQNLSNYNTIYFTTESGKNLNKYVLGNKESTLVSEMFSTTATLINVYNNNLYYIDNSGFYKYGNDNILFYTSVIEPKAFVFVNENFIIEKGASNLIKHTSNNENTILYESSADLLFVTGNYLYFLQDGSIKAIDLNDTSKAALIVNGDSTIKSDISSKVSCDGYNIYYYKKWVNKSNVDCYYLERVTLSGDFNKVSVASKIDADMPPEEENNNPTNS